MPAKCVSSVSPRFLYRRLALCFLPLATILESPVIVLEFRYELLENKAALDTFWLETNVALWCR
jgi:hypothetical protein